MDEVPYTSYSYRKILSILYPVMISQFAIIFTGFLELVFIKKFGPLAIASVAVGNVCFAVILNILESFRATTSILISRELNKSNGDNVYIMSSSLLFAVIIGVIIFSVSSIMSKLIYAAFNNRSLNNIGIPYLHYMLWSVPFILLVYVFSGYYRGRQNSFIPLCIWIAIFIINVILSYILINGYALLRPYNVNGIAFATIIAFGIGAASFIIMHIKEFGSYFFIISYSYDIHIFKKFFNMLISIAANNCNNILAILLFVFIISKIGAKALAIHQIIYQIFLLFYCPSLGLYVTSSILSSYLISIGQRKYILMAASKVYNVSFFYAILSSMIIFFISPFIVLYFKLHNIDDTNTIISMIHIICLIQIILSITMVTKGILTGLNYTRLIFISEMFSAFVIFIPCAIMFTKYASNKLMGAYIASLLWAIANFLILSYNLYKYWRANDFLYYSKDAT